MIATQCQQSLLRGQDLISELLAPDDSNILGRVTASDHLYASIINKKQPTGAVRNSSAQAIVIDNAAWIRYYSKWNGMLCTFLLEYQFFYQFSRSIHDGQMQNPQDDD
jgi:hypothetical protein